MAKPAKNPASPRAGLQCVPIRRYADGGPIGPDTTPSTLDGKTSAGLDADTSGAGGNGAEQTNIWNSDVTAQKKLTSSDYLRGTNYGPLGVGVQAATGNVTDPTATATTGIGTNGGASDPTMSQNPDGSPTTPVAYDPNDPSNDGIQNAALGFIAGMVGLGPEYQIGTSLVDAYNGYTNPSDITNNSLSSQLGRWASDLINGPTGLTVDRSGVDTGTTDTGGGSDATAKSGYSSAADSNAASNAMNAPVATATPVTPVTPDTATITAPVAADPATEGATSPAPDVSTPANPTDPAGLAAADSAAVTADTGAAPTTPVAATTPDTTTPTVTAGLDTSAAPVTAPTAADATPTAPSYADQLNSINAQMDAIDAADAAGQDTVGLGDRGQLSEQLQSLQAEMMSVGLDPTTGQAPVAAPASDPSVDPSVDSEGNPVSSYNTTAQDGVQAAAQASQDSANASGGGESVGHSPGEGGGGDADGGQINSLGTQRPNGQQALLGPGLNLQGQNMATQPRPSMAQLHVQNRLANPQAMAAMKAHVQQGIDSGKVNPQQIQMLGQLAHSAVQHPELWPKLRQFAIQTALAKPTDIPMQFSQSLCMGLMAAAAAAQHGDRPGAFANGGAITSNGQGHGGVIHGPGTGVSDSVHAQNSSTGQPLKVSNGEYVIPADVVATKGKEFFDNIVRKYHTPAALQR